MPLDRFVLILVLIIGVALVTVWLGALLLGALQLGAWGGIVLIPVILIAYVVWRVVADRLKSREDDHYDRIEK